LTFFYKIGPDGITPAGIIQVLAMLNQIYHDEEFYSAEFTHASLSADALCNAITNDLKQSFERDIKTVDDLNILLTMTELYDQYHSLKPSMVCSQELVTLVSEAEKWIADENSGLYDPYTNHL